MDSPDEVIQGLEDQFSVTLGGISGCEDISPFCWYFIKPVVFGNSTDGEPALIRASSDQKPDAMALYCLPQQVSWSARSTRVVGTYATYKQARDAMTHFINRDKAIHLLGGQPPEPDP